MSSSSRKKSQGSLGDQLRTLLPDGKTRVFRAEQIVFTAGDPGDGFYIVEKGSVRISAVIGENEPRTLATIGVGDVFGEMSVLDEAPRSATATASEDTTVVFIERDQLLRLLEQQPQLALALIREFSQRMRVSNQKYLDEIVQAERLAAIGRFAGTIVHDFKNPLTVIALAAELGCQNEIPFALRQKAQARITRQIDRMNNLLHELIEFTKPSGQRTDLHPVNFAAFVTPLLEEIAAEVAARRVELALPGAAPDVGVSINAQRLSRVFYNLINNAVDEMRQGGQIQVRFTTDRKELTVAIQDTGRGIPPEIAKSLFQPFATHGKAQGSGLGLSICKKIVEDHGGRIWVESTPGSGATFSFTLPLSE